MGIIVELPSTIGVLVRVTRRVELLGVARLRSVVVVVTGVTTCNALLPGITLRRVLFIGVTERIRFPVIGVTVLAELPPPPLIGFTVRKTVLVFIGVMARNSALPAPALLFIGITDRNSVLPFIGVMARKSALLFIGVTARKSGLLLIGVTERIIGVPALLFKAVILRKSPLLLSLLFKG